MPKWEGWDPVWACLQVSTDGVNYTDLASFGGSSGYSFSPSASNLYFRYRWRNEASLWQTLYIGPYGPVPAITSAPVVSLQAGVVSWDMSRGRSWARLTWPALAGAAGYKPYVWDGYAYRTKDLGNATSWDSRVAKIFPYPSELPENNSVSTDIFRWDGSGLDLEDTARRLYRTTVGTQYDGCDNYWFRVTAYNQWMETDFN
ncbi:MAG: hypothetical protein H5T97_02960, partial [Firmicutes bacterium]|nr:hypothetical protein [Bacillota bacterium]